MDYKDRFEKKFVPITKSGCWIWTGRIAREYGRFLFKGKNNLAHRVSYMLYVGAIPKGLKVLHRCDVPSCVNPNHLFLGTQLDNVRDMFSKGRQPKCKANTNSAKLTLVEVNEIRKSNRSVKELSLSYGVTRETIYNIVNYKTWRIQR